MNVSVTIPASLSATLRQLSDALGGNARAELNRAMGTEVQHVTAEHLRSLAATRHETSARLGASPSNHLAQAAEKVAAPAAVSANSSGATLTINHVGMVRALRDVTIRPRTAQSLAIPIHAIAYNRRPAQLWESHNLFIPKGKNVIVQPGAGKDAPPLALYALVRSVTQKQDRTLLPSDEQLSAAAAKGAKTYIRYLMGNAAET